MAPTTLNTEVLCARLVPQEGAAVVSLVGTADARAARRLPAWLAEAHRWIVEKCVPEIVVDLTELQFMSSACFREIVKWVTGSSGSRIRFLIKPQSHWQQKSVRAIVALSDGHASIEEKR